MNQPNVQVQPNQATSEPALPEGNISASQGADLLAARRNALAEPPSPVDPLESVEAAESEFSDGTTETDSPEYDESAPLDEAAEEFDEEPESPEEDNDQPEDELDEAAQAFELDGEEITVDQVKEWRDNGLRQAEFTRKTQVLAQQTEAIGQLEQNLNSFAYAWQQEHGHLLQAAESELQQFANVNWVELAKENPNEYNAKKSGV